MGDDPVSEDKNSTDDIKETDSTTPGAGADDARVDRNDRGPVGADAKGKATPEASKDFLGVTGLLSPHDTAVLTVARDQDGPGAAAAAAKLERNDEALSRLTPDQQHAYQRAESKEWAASRGGDYQAGIEREAHQFAAGHTTAEHAAGVAGHPVERADNLTEGRPSVTRTDVADAAGVKSPRAGTAEAKLPAGEGAPVPGADAVTGSAVVKTVAQATGAVAAEALAALGAGGSGGSGGAGAIESGGAGAAERGGSGRAGAGATETNAAKRAGGGDSGSAGTGGARGGDTDGARGAGGTQGAGPAATDNNPPATNPPATNPPATNPPGTNAPTGTPMGANSAASTSPAGYAAGTHGAPSTADKIAHGLGIENPHQREIQDAAQHWVGEVAKALHNHDYPPRPPVEHAGLADRLAFADAAQKYLNSFVEPAGLQLRFAVESAVRDLRAEQTFDKVADYVLAEARSLAANTGHLPFPLANPTPHELAEFTKAVAAAWTLMPREDQARHYVAECRQAAAGDKDLPRMPAGVTLADVAKAWEHAHLSPTEMAHLKGDIEHHLAVAEMRRHVEDDTLRGRLPDRGSEATSANGFLDPSRPTDRALLAERDERFRASQAYRAQYNEIAHDSVVAAMVMARAEEDGKSPNEVLAAGRLAAHVLGFLSDVVGGTVAHRNAQYGELTRTPGPQRDSPAPGTAYNRAVEPSPENRGASAPTGHVPTLQGIGAVRDTPAPGHVPTLQGIGAVRDTPAPGHVPTLMGVAPPARGSVGPAVPDAGRSDAPRGPSPLATTLGDTPAHGTSALASTLGSLHPPGNPHRDGHTLPGNAHRGGDAVPGNPHRGDTQPLRRGAEQPDGVHSAVDLSKIPGLQSPYVALVREVASAHGSTESSMFGSQAKDHVAAKSGLTPEQRAAWRVAEEREVDRVLRDPAAMAQLERDAGLKAGSINQALAEAQARAVAAPAPNQPAGNNNLALDGPAKGGTQPLGRHPGADAQPAAGQPDKAVDRPAVGPARGDAEGPRGRSPLATSLGDLPARGTSALASTLGDLHPPANPHRGGDAVPGNPHRGDTESLRPGAGQPAAGAGRPVPAATPPSGSVEALGLAKTADAPVAPAQPPAARTDTFGPGFLGHANLLSPQQEQAAQAAWRRDPGSSDGQRALTILQVHSNALHGLTVGQAAEYRQAVLAEHPQIASIDAAAHANGYLGRTDLLSPHDRGVVQAWGHQPGNAALAKPTLDADSRAHAALPPEESAQYRQAALVAHPEIARIDAQAHANGAIGVRDLLTPVQFREIVAWQAQHPGPGGVAASLTLEAHYAAMHGLSRGQDAAYRQESLANHPVLSHLNAQAHANGFLGHQDLLSPHQSDVLALRLAVHPEERADAQAIIDANGRAQLALGKDFAQYREAFAKHPSDSGMSGGRIVDQERHDAWAAALRHDAGVPSGWRPAPPGPATLSPSELQARQRNSTLDEARPSLGGGAKQDVGSADTLPDLRQGAGPGSRAGR